MPVVPELWILRDADYEVARRLVLSAGSAVAAKLECLGV
jgi:hypothetical protein